MIKTFKGGHTSGIYQATKQRGLIEGVRFIQTSKIDPNAKPVPNLSIQCFERRHAECSGTNTFFNGKCEDSCHKEISK